MDLPKGSDSLPHGPIIAKVHAYGLHLPACNLLGRKQRVKISNSRSSWAVLTKGMPQGPILGPLLFNIFMQDLFLFIGKCQLYNYPDDNSLDSSSENLTDVLFSLIYHARIAMELFAKMLCKPTLRDFALCCFILRLRNDRPYNYVMAGFSCLKLR